MDFYNKIKFRRISDNREYLFELFTEAASATNNKNIIQAIESAISNHVELELLDSTISRQLDNVNRSDWERQHHQKLKMYEKAFLKIQMPKPDKYSQHQYKGVYDILTEDELFNFPRIADQVDLIRYQLMISDKGDYNVSLDPTVEGFVIVIL